MLCFRVMPNDAALLVRVPWELKAWVEARSLLTGAPQAEIIRRVLTAAMEADPLKVTVPPPAEVGVPLVAVAERRPHKWRDNATFGKLCEVCHQPKSKAGEWCED